MNEQDRLLIERYYRQELTEAERLSVEQRLASDPAFRAAAQLHEKAIGAIRLWGRADLKKRLADRPLKREPGSRKGLFVHVLLLLAVVVAWWIWPAPLVDAPAPAPAPPTVPPVDTPALPPAAPPGRSQPAASPKTIPAAELFASTFKPYTEASLQVTVRDNTPQTPLNTFLQSYTRGQYDQAIASFELLPATLKDAPKTQLLLANALLATRQPVRAAAILAPLSQSAHAKYAADGRWYLALSQLASGELSRARAALELIRADASSSHQAEARDLLKKLQ
ncbi:MAG: hypothetical protein IT260_18240 [Saprospiraceae bacterium]|nr:hypothetical protein [Saprospiraceae bacterium]